MFHIDYIMTAKIFLCINMMLLMNFLNDFLQALIFIKDTIFWVNNLFCPYHIYNHQKLIFIRILDDYPKHRVIYGGGCDGVILVEFVMWEMNFGVGPVQTKISTKS